MADSDVRAQSSEAGSFLNCLKSPRRRALGAQRTGQGKKIQSTSRNDLGQRVIPDEGWTLGKEMEGPLQTP